MNIVKNDKIILVKEFGNLKMVGECYEVGNITETSVIVRDVKTKVAMCAIDIDDFPNYFEKSEDMTGWTNWQKFVDFNGNTVGFYKTNFKRVQVKLVENNTRSMATCSRGDEFNLHFGIQLAYMRCLNKAYIKKEKVCENELKNIRSNIKQTNHVIKYLVNSLI